MPDSRQKLKLFLANLAQGQGPELPAVAKLAVRGLLPRILADVDEADPDELDATMLEVARVSIGMRSDGAEAFEVVSADPDQAIRAESNGEPRTEEPRHQTPGESAVAAES